MDVFTLLFSIEHTYVGLVEVSDLKQNIWYFAQINESPTSISVFIEKLKRAKIIAEECGKKNISVTYDLAIAKIVLKIQSEESLTYDKISVHLGAFHFEMACFCAIGKYIAESGGPYILNECRISERVYDRKELQSLQTYT